MNKKKILFCMVVVLVTIGWIFGSSQSLIASSKPIELSFMHYLPATHFVHTKMVLPWVKMIERESKGKVKFTVYPAAALAKPKDFFDAVAAGSIDIVHGYSGYTPGRFPVSDVAGLPFLGARNTVAASKAFMELWRTVPEIANEWKAVKVLWFETHPPMQLFTTKKPVGSLTDMKGLKIKIAGRPAPYLKALGATPIVMSSPEVYDSLSKGVIDGCIYPWTEIKGGFRLDELCFFYTELSFYTMPFFVAMNWGKWKSLPSDIQGLLEKYGSDYGMEFFAKIWDKHCDNNLEWAKKDPKRKILYLPEADKAKARELMKPYYRKWITDMANKKIDGQAILDKTISLSEKYSK